MPNPLAIAAKGKGLLPLISRGRAIINRYGVSASTMDRSLASLSDMLKQFKCSATLPFTAVPLARHMAIAQKYQNLGIEIIIHGLTHVDYSALGLEQQRNHIRRARLIFEKMGLRASGFRCPYLRWNKDTLQVIKEYNFAYDASQALALDLPNFQQTDAYRHVLGFYGAQRASEYLALPRLDEDLVRIQYCLPDDEALVERLKITDSNVMSDIWLAMLERIYQTGELFTLGLHPERFSLCEDALRKVLKKARSLSPEVWIARLDEIVSWYRSLGNASFDLRQESADRLSLSIKAPSQAVVLVRSLVVEATTQPWAQGFKQVLSRDFSFNSTNFPIIGISPDSTPLLHNFLQHQGYLVMTSTNGQAFPFYLRRTTFNPQDERSLLAEIDHADWPLIRLSRWPGGAQCGLTITGDVDALTLWDYGQRLWGK
jgi:hypothetical protein